MEFNSINAALHYAKGSSIDIVIIHNDVIDVTQFKISHPGGQESIERYIGTDCTVEYDKVKSHLMRTAVNELQNFKIGYVKTDKENKIIKDDIQETDVNYPIDLKKPSVWQVYKNLNKKEYMAFIHDPKHMIDPPYARLFESDFFEFFSHTNWFFIPMIYIPIILYCMYDALFNQFVTIPQLFVCYFIGIFLWTLMEYGLHRFVFHCDDSLPDQGWAFLLHYLLHGIHHAFPMEKTRLVFPPVLGIPTYKLFLVTFTYIFNDFATAFLAGTITGYLMYDMTHYFLHHFTPSVPYFKFLKKYHILHHYKGDNSGYGVSQHFWDWVFDTVIEDEKK